MKNKLKSVRSGSKSASAPQPKTAQSRAIVRPESNPPCIALFPQGDTSVSEEVIGLSKAEYAELKRAARPTRDGVLMFLVRAGLEKARWPSGTGHQPIAGSDSPSGYCIFDRAVGEVVSEIPLAGAQLDSVVVASHQRGITADQFIADAIKEKLGEQPSDQISKRAPAKTAVQRSEVLEYAGDMLTGNHWIQIGLTRSQVRAITRLGKRWSIRKSPCATMARHLISLSLLNLAETEAKLEALTRYIKAEGFLSLGKYCNHVMRAQERLAKKLPS
jgi:hypothetical protein